ncbi:MAG: methyltransferase domain-containing protein [Bacteroidia bacterium]
MQFRNPGAIIEQTLRYRFLTNYFRLSEKKDTLLDLGCGPRPYRELYADSFTKSIGAEHPDSHFPKNDIDLFCLATDIPLESESINTVLCTEVMHDIAEPSEMLDEIYRLLKVNGELILTTPFVAPIVDGPYDHYRFTGYGLEYLLRKSGFEIVKIYPVGDVFASTITLWIKPWLKLFNVLSKKTGIRAIYSVYNPLMFISTTIPQLLYLWTMNLPVFKQLYNRFSYGCIGFICHARKTAR